MNNTRYIYVVLSQTPTKFGSMIRRRTKTKYSHISISFDEKLIELAKKCQESKIPQISTHIGRVVSGDIFVSDKAVKNDLISTYDGYCCEMEGAAIAHAAYLNNIPFLIIRAISDKADDSASMDYPTFEAMAIENSVKLMKEMIKAI